MKAAPDSLANAASRQRLKVVLLAGGVGGARMAQGLNAAGFGKLTIVANVGDDDRFYGLHVSPDIDTILYTLAGRIAKERGWGVEDDGGRALSTLADLGEDTWMTLGDADLGLHIWRTMKLAEGWSLTRVTREAAARFGLSADLLPATDDEHRTRIVTEAGRLDFQDWFVRQRCCPAVAGLEYGGAPPASVSEAVVEAIGDADIIVIAPSNPFLSIQPILALPGMRDLLVRSSAFRVGISPIVAGAAVKGPLGALLSQWNHAVSPAGVAGLYDGLLDLFVIDEGDRAQAPLVEATGIGCVCGNILIKELPAARDLACLVAELARDKMRPAVA